jgi:Tol biopolymer transport system component
MRRRRVTELVAWGTAAATVALGLPAGAVPRPGVTARVSVATDGSQGNGDAGLGPLAMTPDGRFVAFTSSASNLVPGDTNGSPDLFLHDRRTGTTRLISAGVTGRTGHVTVPLCGAGAGAASPSISNDGRYVAFTSCFDDLTAHDVNLGDDVYVRDMRTNSTTLVSVNSQGASAIGSSTQPSISADGRYVAFSSTAANLDPGHCGTDVESQALCDNPASGVLFARQRIYLRDLVKKTTTLMSIGNNGAIANGTNNFPSLSANARWIAFTTTADNLSADDTNVHCAAELVGNAPSCPDVYLHDRVTGKTELISYGVSGHAALNGSSTVPSTRAVSDSGRYVAFKSGSNDVVPNSQAVGIYVRDRVTRRTVRASVNSDGSELQMGDGTFMLSGDGRFVAFDDAETMSQCSPQPVQAVRFDLLVGSLEAEDRYGPGGVEYGCNDYYHGNDAVISADGRYVGFATSGSHLVRGDTNGKVDIFVRDRGASSGVGGLAGAHSLVVAGARQFATTGIVAGSDALDDVDSAMTALGANLIGAQLCYRPDHADLFLRLAVAQMPMMAIGSSALVYGADLTVDGVHYQVRIAKTGPLAASYGVFRAVSGGGWAPVASLHGGYGTTGQEVVVAIPLAAIGSRHGGHLSGVAAFTGIGSYEQGPVHELDRLTL